jgi:hypothetical protein
MVTLSAQSPWSFWVACRILSIWNVIFSMREFTAGLMLRFSIDKVYTLIAWLMAYKRTSAILHPIGDRNNKSANNMLKQGRKHFIGPSRVSWHRLCPHCKAIDIIVRICPPPVIFREVEWTHVIRAPACPATESGTNGTPLWPWMLCAPIAHPSRHFIQCHRSE